jgi:glycosyltransferase involved in cell wall biosynthesis
MLRVAMIADYPFGKSAVDGGVQAVSTYLARELVRSSQVDLRVISFSKKVTRATPVADGDVQGILLPEHRFSHLTRFWRARKDVAAVLNDLQPDLVHGQGAGLEGYAAVRSGFPSVVTFHGIIAEDAKYMSSLRSRVRLMLQSKIAEDYCVRFASHTILISPYVRRHYGDDLAGTASHIPNPTTSDFFGVDSSGEGAQLLFAGRLIPRKGVLDLIRAVGQLGPEFRVTVRLAGSQSDAKHVAELKKCIAVLGMQDRVHFLGLLDQARLIEEFQNASMLVLPSYQETAPMVVQQAMAAKVPVVATNICGIPDQLENGRCGLLFEPGDVESMARNIALLLSDRARRDQIVTAAYLKACAEFDVQKVAAATIDFYESVLRDSR